MNLIIDIGNTSAKLALFENGELVGDIVHTDNRSLAGLASFAAAHPAVDKAILSSVIPLDDTLKVLLEYLPFSTLMFSSETPLPLPPVYKFPKEMGTDRIAADVAAIKAAKNHPVLVFDAGTCLTSELLTPTEGLIGGTISPGFRLRLVSMHEHTSALPLIESTVPHPILLGHDTTTAMLMGAANSIVFEIEGYVNRLTAKFPGLRVFVTGGDTFSFDKMLKTQIIQDKLLLLRGLNYILEFNQ